MGEMGIQLVLMEPDGKLKSLWINGNSIGKYRFEDKTEIDDYFYIESENDKWFLRCTKGAKIALNEHEYTSTTELLNRQLVAIFYKNRQHILYVEFSENKSNKFTNYIIYGPEITIGRSDENDIWCRSKVVSGKHAKIYLEDNKWYIEDTNSLNGVYLNNRQIKKSQLKVGDNIYIIGLRILFGGTFLSINYKGDDLGINPQKLVEFIGQENFKGSMVREGNNETDGEETIFNRLPRRRKAMPDNKIVVEGPPMPMNNNSIPIMLRMGGSMVMSGTSMLSGNYTMMLSSVLFPILTSKYTENQKKQYESKRVELYTKYLQNKRQEIIREKENEEYVLNENYQSVNQLLTYVVNGLRLWERKPNDDDFLDLRIGKGDIPILAEYKYPEEKFGLDDDELEDKMYQLVEKKEMLRDVPIMTSLVKDFISSVQGEEKIKLAFLKNLIVQIAMSHSYDEVKMVFLLEDKELEEIEFIKYLPHVWNDEKSFRFIATNISEAMKIGEYLKSEAEASEKGKKLSEIMEKHPYYVVMSLNKKLFDSIEVFKDIRKAEENRGFSIITFFDDMPRESTKIFNLDICGSNTVIYIKDIDKESEKFELDMLDEKLLMSSMKKLFNTQLKVISENYSLPKTITFLEMFNVGKVEYLNPMKRWSDNNPVNSLATEIGVGTDGELFYLDLHEKHQGPHGLVAGMTGSGKSEFIITYILSMAINYHPDEVAFILIDYKGGGLAGAFEDEEKGIHLPHLAGTITNLDGAAIQRSLMSIQSELMRRQRIFNEVKSMANEGTMDIYKYQKLYRNGKVDKPLPHLFIISDEFAELKQQEPEFMNKLISAARIGRSLGVHLILATQKPAGVVNDQILSNTKFRVCLKVQDKMDSMDMLKRPEAAELKDTGRFYLQVGYNEYFGLGQSAWCGADYEPADEVKIIKDESIQFLDNIGQVVHQIQPKVEKQAATQTQIVSIVKMLSDIAKQQNIKVRKLWKEPLAKFISYEKLERKYGIEETEGITALLGETDDPENQSQSAYSFDLMNCKNMMIVGESGTGKTTLLKTMLYSLAERYDADTVNFYILDFSSKLLRVFGKLPHCGAFLTEEQETDIDRCIKLIEKIIEERKQLFADAEVNSFDMYCKKKKIPLIVVVVDNIAGLMALGNGNRYFGTFHEYMRDGQSYGIKFILTGTHLNDFNSKVKQEALDRIAIQLKDKYEYGDTLNCRCQYIPGEINGRGMVVVEGRPLEFHVAVPGYEQDDNEQLKYLKERIDEIAERNQDCTGAEKLPCMDENETFEAFCTRFKSGRLPLGYHVETMKPVAIPFKQLFSLSLYFGNKKGFEPVMTNYLYAINRANAKTLIVRRKENSIFTDDMTDNSEIEYFESDEESSKKLYLRLCDEINSRKEYIKEYAGLNDIALDNPRLKTMAKTYVDEKTVPMFIIYENYAEFCENAAEECLAVLTVLYEEKNVYNMYYIACFEPDDARSISSKDAYKSFNKDELCIMYGGRYDRQNIVNLPYKYSNMDAELENYGYAMMNYRGELYGVNMPVEYIGNQMIDEDEKSIFELD